MKSMGKPLRSTKRKDNLEMSSRHDSSKKIKGSTSAERPISVRMSSSSDDEDDVPLIRRYRARRESASVPTAPVQGVPTSPVDPQVGVQTPAPFIVTADESHVVLSAPVPPSSAPTPSMAPLTEEEAWAKFGPGLVKKKPKLAAVKRTSVQTPVIAPPSEPSVAPSSSTGPKSPPGRSSSRSKPIFKESPRKGTGVATPSQSVPERSSAPSAPSTSATKKTKKVATKFRPPTPFSSVFITKAASERLPVVRKMTFLSERKLDTPSYLAKSNILPIIASCSLEDTVCKVHGFPAEIIQEFFCNLSPEVFDPTSTLYQRVFVRGCFFLITPSLINAALGVLFSNFPTDELDFDEVISTITGGAFSTWPQHKDFPSSALIVPYSLLHKVALFNWMPSRHATGVKKSLAGLLHRIGKLQFINLGQIIFDSLAAYATMKVNSSSLIFPNSIFQLLLSQESSLGGTLPLVPVSIMKLTDKSFKKASSSSASGVPTPSQADLQESVLSLQQEVSDLKARLHKAEGTLAKVALHLDISAGTSSSSSF